MGHTENKNPLWKGTPNLRPPKKGVPSEFTGQNESKEIITIEAKIEHMPSRYITASHVGQAHNQVERARAEFSPLGYQVTGTIITHLTELAGDAESSAGALRCISKDSILDLWASRE